MYGLILCAGRGTRIQPLSDILPKPLLPIAGKPVIFHTIETLRQFDLEGIGLVIQEQDLVYYQRFLTYYFSDLSVDLFFQQELTGIVTAIQSADKYKDKSILVCAGDTQFLPRHVSKFFSADYLDRYTMMIGIRQRKPEELLRRSVIAVDYHLQITDTIEKPTPEQLTNIGSNWSGVPIWYFSAECWQYFPTSSQSNNGEYAVEGVISQILDQSEQPAILGIEVADAADITYPEDVLKLNFDYLEHLMS